MHSYNKRQRNRGNTRQVSKMNEAEIQKHSKIIDMMSHADMARVYRFSPSGHPYFDDRLPLDKRFVERFGELGGMTPAISKLIGLEP